MNALRQLWSDEQGAIVSVEVLVIATVVGIGLMTAWVMVRDAVIIKIEEQAEWITGEELCDDEPLLSIDGPDGGDVLTCADVLAPGG